MTGKSKKLLSKKYPCIKQHDVTDCGAAALATVLKTYGSSKSISEIREIAGTDRIGTNGLGLVKAAEKLGFTAKGVRGTPDALKSEFPLPAIANVVTAKGLLHYVVIHRIKDGKVLVADPALGLREYTLKEFCDQWTGVLILLVPTAHFEKSSSENALLRFVKLLIPQKRLLAFIFLASLIITAFGILGSFYFRVLMDTIIPGSLMTTLTTVSIGLIVLYVVKSLMEFCRGQLMLHLSQKLDIPLVLGYYQHVLNLPMNFFGTRRIGEIVSRFMDASRIRDAISGAALTIMIDSLMAIVGGIVLFTQNSTLFVIALIMAVLYAIVVFSFNPFIRKTNEKQMEDNAQLTSYLVESLNGVETIKAYGSERRVQEKTDSLFVKFLKEVFKGGGYQNLQRTLTDAIAIIGETVILWVGATFVIGGTMTLGELITFNALMVYFVDPLKNLINLQPQLQTAFVAADRLAEIMDLEVEEMGEESGKLNDISLLTDITINDVSFRYGTRRLVLEDIDMFIGKGQSVALVGESGSGKTTIAKLLLQFYDWEKGTIFFGKTNALDINKTTIRERIAYVPQENFFFSGTIRENLTMGNPNISFEEVVGICESLGVSEFVNKMPLRYETHLEEGAANLSGGQRQRLSVARALLHKPDVMILDEATSNLDSISEQKVQQTIREHTSDITTITIAHRLSTITNSDMIYVLQDGKVVEKGNHAALVAENGIYSDLWARQTAGALIEPVPARPSSQAVAEVGGSDLKIEVDG